MLIGMTLRFLLPVAVLALPLVFAACGDDDDSPEPTQPGGTGPTQQGGTPGAPATATPTVESGGTPGTFTGNTDPVRKEAPADLKDQPLLRNVRAAAQEGFDRIVFEFAGDEIPGYAIEYKDAAIACGSGQDVTGFIGGGQAPPAMLMVDLRPAAAHDDNGNATAARDVPARLATITRAFSTCDFEGQVEYAVALTAEQPFRVSTLEDPPRIVIDIAR